MNDLLPITVSAFGIGVLHAFEPGHGKTLLIGALADARRSWKDPLLLASSTALGHMAGVLVFAAASFLFTHEFVEGSAKFYFEALIGTFVAMIGVLMFRRMLWNDSGHPDGCGCCGAGKGIIVEIGARRRMHLGLVGILVGLVPCPSALALAATTATLGSISQALSVAFVFGMGVAFALLVIAVSISLFWRRINTLSSLSRYARYVRLISPVSLIVLGTMIVLHAGDHAH